MFKVPEYNRVKHDMHPSILSDPSYGNNGMFRLRRKVRLQFTTIFAQASDGGGWEHVSVSIAKAKRCPSWNEMCWVKDLFWDPEDTIIQFHPPESEYVSQHDYALHLWRKVGENWQTPPSIFVGTEKKKQ